MSWKPNLKLVEDSEKLAKDLDAAGQHELASWARRSAEDTRRLDQQMQSIDRMGLLTNVMMVVTVLVVLTLLAVVAVRR